jgi:TRAP-type C4-dicarboxylate transport system permease small subunit
MREAGTPRVPGSGAAEAWFVRLNQWLVIALMAAMAVLVFANVVSRYLLNYSVIWVEEITRYMMVWLGFLGSGLVLRYGAHIAVDVLQDVLPTRAAQALRAAIVALLGATFAAMAWLGVRYAAFAWGQETPALGWSTGLIYLAIPLGSLLMLAHLLLIARGYIVARRFEKHAAFHPEDAVL